MMSEHITRKQLLEGRIRQIETALANKVRKRNRTRESANELRAKLAAYKRELNAL